MAELRARAMPEKVTGAIADGTAGGEWGFAENLRAGQVGKAEAYDIYAAVRVAAAAMNTAQSARDTLTTAA